MTTNEDMIDMKKFLTRLVNEEEFIIKPFQSGNEIGASECGKIVSRMNKTLFDYQIGDKTNGSAISSVFTQRIFLTLPGTKQIVLEFHQSRLPFFCRVCCQQEVRCSSTAIEENSSIGSIRQGYV